MAGSLQWCVITLAFVMFFSSHLNGQAPQNVPLEITHVDLFALKNWNSRQVSISGFMLGMSRMDVFRIIPKQLRLDDAAGQGCLKEKACNALSSGRYVGLSLFFGENNDALEKITIEAPSSEMPKDDRSAWLVNEFHGETQQFFNTHSEDVWDVLRARLFGSADSYWVGTREDKSRKRSLFDPRRQYSATRGYEYRRLGLIVRQEYHQSIPLFELAVDFVSPTGR